MLGVRLMTHVMTALFHSKYSSSTRTPRFPVRARLRKKENRQPKGGMGGRLFSTIGNGIFSLSLKRSRELCLRA